MALALGVARRYARAFADVVFAAAKQKPRAEAEKAAQQLADFAALLREHAGLRTTLASPAVARAQKRALLDKLRGPLGLSDLTRNLLALLIDNRRLGLLASIRELYEQEIYARAGVVPVEVTSAVALDAKQKKLLEERLAALAGAGVELRYRESAALLGGATARMGSTVYDGSLRAQLQRLERELAAR